MPTDDCKQKSESVSLREKAVRNFCTIFLITLKAEELESFRIN